MQTEKFTVASLAYFTFTELFICENKGNEEFGNILLKITG